MFCHVCFVFLVEPANMPAQCRRKDGGILVQTSKTTYVVAYKPIHVCAKFLFASWRSIWTCWVYSTARAGSLAQDYLRSHAATLHAHYILICGFIGGMQTSHRLHCALYLSSFSGFGPLQLCACVRARSGSRLLFFTCCFTSPSLLIALSFTTLLVPSKFRVSQ